MTMTKSIFKKYNLINNVITNKINKPKFCLVLAAKFELEPVTFESFKRLYLAASLVSKTRGMNLMRRRAITSDRAGLFSWASLNFTRHSSFRVTKLIEDYTLFQDLSTHGLRVDENVVKMQRKYGLE